MVMRLCALGFGGSGRRFCVSDGNARVNGSRSW